LGVEIEVEFPTHEDRKRGIMVRSGYSDGSLNCGAEYKILGETKKLKKIINKCSVILEDVWMRRARITRRCGLHVHLDVRRVSRERLQEVFTWMTKTQNIWFSLMPRSRHGNSYCRKISTIVSTDHYDWVHKTSFHTIEIRLHSGTINPYKIAGWLTAMAYLQSKIYDVSYQFPKIDEGNTAESAFWSFWENSPKEAKEYLQSRKSSGGCMQDYAFQPLEEGASNV
jgi:hypothetical protein